MSKSRKARNLSRPKASFESDDDDDDDDDDNDNDNDDDDDDGGRNLLKAMTLMS